VSAALPFDARVIQRDRAGLFSRGAAGAIDLVVVASGVFVAVIAASVWRFFFGGSDVVRLAWPSRVGLASLGGALLAAYLTWGWARTGRTIGKRLLGLAVVRSSGAPLGWFRALARSLLCVAFPVGLLWCAVSSTNRSVHDLLTGTAVIYDWHNARGKDRLAP
jgi:uncharacterized RDD family membrane protein YckC